MRNAINPSPFNFGVKKIRSGLLFEPYNMWIKPTIYKLLLDYSQSDLIPVKVLSLLKLQLLYEKCMKLEVHIYDEVN